MKKLLSVLISFIFLFFFGTKLSLAATYTVTKTADTNDGTCDADCSLREALATANGNAGADTINFSIPQGDAGYSAANDNWTITLGSGLTVSASQSVTFDGSTQTGTTAMPTYGGKIIILTNTNISALTVTASGSDLTLKYLTFKNTSSTTQLQITGTTAALVVQYCYFTRDVYANNNNSALGPNTFGNINVSNNKFDDHNRVFGTTNTDSTSTTTVDSNLIVNAGSISIRILGGYNVSITNNTISYGSEGIISTCSGGACLISGNTISTYSTVQSFAAIEVKTASGVTTVSNNNVNTYDTMAITVVSAPATISNNTITGYSNGALTTGKININTNDITKPVTIQNNTINVSNTIPIFITGVATRAKITGNTILTSFGYTPINISGGTEDARLITSNDAGDIDSGVNNLMNSPVITSVSYLGGSQYKVDGSLDGQASEAPFTIEVCLGDYNPSGRGGCSSYLGSTTTSTSNWSATVTIVGDNGTQCRQFSATATNVNNSTSEFSNNVVFGNCNPGTPSNNVQVSSITAPATTVLEKNNLISIVSSGTFKYDAKLTVEETPKVGTFKIPNTNYWKAGSEFETTWKSSFNNAEIKSSEVIKPFTLIFKYNPSSLEKSLPEKSLKLAYSADGKKWKIIQSILDTKKKELIVVTKNGGHYMIVGGTGGVATPKVQGVKTQKLELPSPTIIPEVKTETPKEYPLPKKHCFLFYCW